MRKRRNGLRRFFFCTFPRGRPGTGLLLLRTTLGAAALLQGGLCWADQAELAAGLLAISAGVLLLAGLITPVASIVAGLCVAGARLAFIAGSGANLFEANLGALLALAIAAGVLLLGPGAYSADARLFGPREIIIPPVHRSPGPPHD